jgi:hypothetical protein
MRTVRPAPTSQGLTVGLGQAMLREAVLTGALTRNRAPPIPSRRAQSSSDALPHVLQSTFQRFIPCNELRHRSILHDHMNI